MEGLCATCQLNVSRYGIQYMFEFILLSDEQTEKHMICLKALRDLGACVNTTLPNRHTILCQAVDNMDARCLLRILKMGAHVDACTQTGNIFSWQQHHNLTARAAGLGFWHGAQLLMEYGAKQPETWYGKTPVAMLQIWKKQLARCWSAKQAMERLLRGTLHKDLAPLISHHIWETRHDSAWKEPQPKTKQKKKG